MTTTYIIETRNPQLFYLYCEGMRIPREKVTPYNSAENIFEVTLTDEQLRGAKNKRIKESPLVETMRDKFD